MCVLAVPAIRTGVPVDLLIVLNVPSNEPAVHCSDMMRNVVFDCG
jgi:hypothetical protein